MNLYDLAYLAASPVAGGLIGYKMARYGKYKESAPAMLGCRLAAENPSLWKDGCVWVHAVSVGEVIAAKAMLPLIRREFPNLPVLLTTHTETGQATAQTLEPEMADAVRYYPMDFSWVVKRFVQTYKPRVFIPMETELWPNALQIIARSGAQIFTLNGKMSERSFGRYLKIGSLIRRPLSQVTAFCVQTPDDARRIGTLLGSQANVHVTGNCKFDVEFPAQSEADKAALAAQLGLPWPARYIVAGSTHRGEEEIILKAMDEIRDAHPDVHLLLVPRHPERFDEVWNLLKGHKTGARRVSDGNHTKSDPRINLVDKMGVLSRLYSLGEIAVVAGSFVDGIGGHNLLEPAAQGVPVVYGPFMKSQPDMVRILTPENGGTRTEPTQLGQSLATLLDAPAEAHRRGELGRTAYESSKGSATRNIEVLRKYLGNKQR